MDRVLKEKEKLLDEPDADTVHDLRVALRRCRSVADVMAEVDPDPGWPEVRKTVKKLFHALGDLRDTQVIEGWVRNLGAEGDAVRSHLQTKFEAQEPYLKEKVVRTARKFDSKKWKRLERHLRRGARLVPPNGPAAECLVLERLESATDLHRLALRTEKPKPWHELRVGIKRFRYTVEGLLPQQYAAWSDDLKRLQDLLGEVHDLDVLRELVERAEAQEADESRSLWQETIARERKTRIATYRQLTLGRTSLWNTWRAGLPTNGRLETAVQARFRATARAVDGDPRRTSEESRIALSIFDALCRVSAAADFQENHTQVSRRVLRAAARLRKIGQHGRRKQAKAARKALQRLPTPPGWSQEDWQALGWTLRFQSGTEPKPKHKGFFELAPSRQTQVRALAGVLRLARALRKSGITTGAGISAEPCGSALVLRVPGLIDTPETGGQIGSAKHLLESLMAKPLSVYPTPKAQPIPVRKPADSSEQHREQAVLGFAQASD
jgi:CHAD domain-containing protein